MSNTKKRERNACSVTNCRSYRDAQKWPEPLTFHEFPADLKRRALWLKAIGKEDWIPPDKAKVCAVHFTPESYRDLNYTAIAHALGVNINNKPLKRLTNTAVPTLHLNLEPLQEEAPGFIEPADWNNQEPLQPAQLCDPLRTQSPEAPTVGQNNKCVVPNCQQYRDANRWTEPLVLYDFPPDQERRSLWISTLRKNVTGSWVIPIKGRICSVHFDKEDFRDPNKKLLKPKAVPILNLILPRLPENHEDGTLLDGSLLLRYRSHHTCFESRKRTTNIIVVDLMKESKKTKCAEKQQAIVENDCGQCLQLLKEVRDLEYQLLEAKSELREQKKLVETLKSKLDSQGEVVVPS